MVVEGIEGVTGVDRLESVLQISRKREREKEREIERERASESESESE